jgi:hypothetical protein
MGNETDGDRRALRLLLPPLVLGAVGSGALLKTIFHKGVTDASFREIAWWTVCSSLVMTVLYLPVLFARRGGARTGVETAN